jgi:hypothetical protein
MNGAWNYQGPTEVAGRIGWRQRSDWNALYVPVPRGGEFEAVQVDVYHPGTSSGFAFYPLSDYRYYNGAENFLGLGGDLTQFTAHRGGWYDGYSSSDGIVELARTHVGVSVGRWFTLRIEMDRELGLARTLIDGVEQFTFEVDYSTLESSYVQLRTGTACCSVPADIAWSNLVIEAGEVRCDSGAD